MTTSNHLIKIALDYINKKDKKPTDYQVSRHLLLKMEPNEAQETLITLRKLGLAELREEDGVMYWEIPDNKKSQ